MSIIADKFNAVFQGVNFSSDPNPYPAKENYRQIGEIRKRTHDAIAELEDSLDNLVITIENNSTSNLDDPNTGKLAKLQAVINMRKRILGAISEELDTFEKMKQYIDDGLNDRYTKDEVDALIISTGSDKHYVHNQVLPISVWTITHNLNKKPSITVVDSGDSIVIGNVEYIDNNTVKITFSGAFSGKAYCN